VLFAECDPTAVVWIRSWFRYLRQTGSAFGLLTIAEALRRAPEASRALVGLFRAAHDPQVRKSRSGGRSRRAAARRGAGERSLDRRRPDHPRMRALVEAIVRTNAFSPAADEAIAFKIDSSRVPALPAPIPWREIWVYSPRVEGIHLRGGPVARGGLRWSDRRDDFRTEILGLMKAQLVKNSVIVPTGAKGGFYPKMLPPPDDRDLWLAEGTASYSIFIRALLSITDNIVDDKVVHPDQVVIRDGRRSLFRRRRRQGDLRASPTSPTESRSSAASGSATPSRAAARTATTTRRWGSPPAAHGFPCSGISWRWASTCSAIRSPSPASATCRATCSGTECCCRGDQARRRLRPPPHLHRSRSRPGGSWAERKRLFELLASTWDDYDRSKISAGGGVFPRTQKSIPLSKQARAALDIDEASVDPATLMNAILKAPVDLMWFGGIGTYVKASTQSDSDVGDPGNDRSE
jgi:glutamate dehydrogenase